ncbi:MAG TPA: hypothetical protein VFR32_05325 [Gaiellaceae bacterium]|nr:hypothetical protein [Gaiellaceae bacterium]
MAEGQASQAPPPPPAAPSEPAQHTSWLRENRLKVALGIAVAEGLFVALEEDFSRVTVIVIAIPVVLFWLLAGRTLDSALGREISWILAMSQALAVVAAIVAILIPIVALIVAGIFGAAAVYLLYHDRPGDSARSAR